MLYSGNVFIVLFFVYGISFFIMGIVALQQNITKETSFPLVKAINSLGYFGLIHAIVEWIVMFAIADIFIGKKANLLIFAVLFNALSFTILLHFGIKVFDYKGKGAGLLKKLPLFALLIWMAAYLSATLLNGAISSDINLDYDTICRYFIGLPAAFVTAAAIYHNSSTLYSMKLNKAAIKFKVLAISFISYGIFAGILVNRRDFYPASIINKQAFLEIFGFPVEFGRMLSAVCITVLFLGIIEIFRLENNLIMHNLMQERVASQERRRLGRELHDGIIQDLFASGLQLESLIEENDLNILHSEIKEIKNNMNNGILKIRDYIDTVSTKQIGMEQFRMQLEATVNNFRKISNADILVDYEIPDITLRYLSSEKLTQVYYIIQEAISNSVKHSNASEIHVKIGYDLRAILVEVKDNGKGFNIGTAKSKRKFGLSSMQERAASIGGILNINSEHKGTLVALAVPWEEGLNE
ncbi:MAG: hypothetical protein K0R84_712 [Clostridia bacterium]|nr:hypothetical protein [Clostridia bacterium]